MSVQLDKIAESEQSAILELVRYFARTFPRTEMIDKYKEVDKAYHMEVHKEISAESGEMKNKDIETAGRFTHIDTPIVRKQVQSEVPFMENIFLSDDPIFTIAKSDLDADSEGTVLGLNSKLKVDSQVGNWQLELSRAILNGIKYNICAAEVFWDTKVVKRKARTMESGAALTNKSVEWTGNKIRALDPYNLLFDTSVLPHEVPEDGEFLINIEAYSQTRLAKLIESIKQYQEANPSEVVYLDVSKGLWESRCTEHSSQSTQDNLWFEIPDITDNPNQGEKPLNWLQHAGYQDVGKVEEKVGLPGTSYVVTKAYLRVIPASLGISIAKDGEAGSDMMPQVWAVYIVGENHILAVIPETNSHGLIPVGLGTPDIDTLGIQGRHSVGCTVSLQKLVGEFLERRIASIDRNISDRAIVDGRYLDINKFKQRVPDAKFTPNSAFARSNKSVAELYYQIPFRDSTTDLLTREIPFISNLAEEANLSNASRYGQFQKGNKTPDEVRQTLANSEAPLLRRAQQFELQIFRIIKLIIQSNLLDFAEPEEMDVGGETVRFDPETLLTKSLKFRLSGGLDPLSVAMRQGVLQEIFSFAQTAPVINSRYDLMKIFEDMYYAKGLDLNRYRITLEQQAAETNAGNGQSGIVPPPASGA